MIPPYVPTWLGTLWVGHAKSPLARSHSGRREICRNPHFVSRSRNPWISSKPNGKQENPDVAWLLRFFNLLSFTEVEHAEHGTWRKEKGRKLGYVHAYYGRKTYSQSGHEHHGHNAVPWNMCGTRGTYRSTREIRAAANCGHVIRRDFLFQIRNMFTRYHHRRRAAKANMGVRSADISQVYHKKSGQLLREHVFAYLIRAEFADKKCKAGWKKTRGENVGKFYRNAKILPNIPYPVSPARLWQ